MQSLRVTLLLLSVATIAAPVAAQGSSSPVFFNVTEKRPVGTYVGNISAIFSQLGSTIAIQSLPTVLFSLVNSGGQYQSWFRVGNKTGVITTAIVINRDSICSGAATCNISLDILIRSPSGADIRPVGIGIIDVNDNAPTPAVASFSVDIPEYVPPNIYPRVELPSVVDIDSPANGIVRFQVINPTPAFYVIMTPSTQGVCLLYLFLNETLIRQTQDKYQFIIVVTDRGGLFGTLNVTVNVGSVVLPIFNTTSYNVSIPENTLVNTVILQVYATYDAKLMYFLQGIGSDSFAISDTGAISVAKPLNYESTNFYSFQAAVQEVNNKIPVTASVQIGITPVNGNPPQITVISLSGSSTVEVKEYLAAGAQVALVRVVDPDTGSGGQFTCRLVGESQNTFALVGNGPITNGKEYWIKTSAVLDRVAKGLYSLTIFCQDDGLDVHLTSYYNVTIVVTENNSPPVFTSTQYSAQVNESSPAGTFLLRVSATTSNVGLAGQVVYSLKQQNNPYVQINSSTGDIWTTVIFNYKYIKSFGFTVVASTPIIFNTTVTLNIIYAYAQTSVKVIDMHDDPPTFKNASYVFLLPESSVVNQTVGFVEPDLLNLDINQTYVISFWDNSSNTNIFQIDPETGQLKTLKPFDRESGVLSYLLVVRIQDPLYPKLYSDATVYVNIADVNDNAPVFLFPSQNFSIIYAPSSLSPGDRVTTIAASDKDYGINAEISYTIYSGNVGQMFSCDSNSGVLTAATSLSKRSNQIITLTIKAADHGTPPLSSTVILTLNITSAAVGVQVGDQQPTNFNRNIVIAVGVVSGVLIVILVIAIVKLLRSHKKAEERAIKKATISSHVQISSMYENSRQKLNEHSAADDDLEIPSYPEHYNHGGPADNNSMTSSISDSGRGSYENPEISSSHHKTIFANATTHPRPFDSPPQPPRPFDSPPPPPRPPRGACVYSAAKNVHTPSPVTPSPQLSRPRPVQHTVLTPNRLHRGPDFGNPGQGGAQGALLDNGRSILYDNRLNGVYLTDGIVDDPSYI